MAKLHFTGTTSWYFNQIVDENINNWHNYQMLMKISKAIDKNVNIWKGDNLPKKYKCWQKYQTLHIYKFWQKCQFWQKGQFDTTINNIPPPPPPPPIWWFWQLVFAVPKRNSDFYHLQQLFKVKVKMSLNMNMCKWVKMKLNKNMNMNMNMNMNYSHINILEMKWIELSHEREAMKPGKGLNWKD